MMHFRGKKVLITGGSRGIGRSTAMAFAEAGAAVAISFRQDSEAATDTCAQLQGDGHFAVKADIANPEAVRRMVEAVSTEFGGLDIVVNNAGVYLPHPITQVSYERWQEAWQDTLSVNLIGAANVCHCVVPHLIRRGGGHIINISSRGAFRGEPNHPAYGAAKAGLNAFSQSLAWALAPYRIFVGVVAPGFVTTDMTQALLDGPAGDAIRAQSPTGQVATPEEVAQAVLFLASGAVPQATGCILDVNGASYLRT